MSSYGFQPNVYCSTCSGYQCHCYNPSAPAPAPQMPPPPPYFPPPPHHHYPQPPCCQPHYPPHHHHHHPPPISYSWVDGNIHGHCPPDAVHGGKDVDGREIYVGRAYHEGDWIPAKVIPGKRACYVPYGGKEHLKPDFQYLCGNRAVHWIPSYAGNHPGNAVPAGKTKSGETLYIGRVHHNRSLTVGKVQPSHKVCYIPFNGKEVAHSSYEVLAFN